uniref:Uncharacterized protein n=1 Tax=Glossina brevipalpis TaxID=37001 RepID=A0A1A9W365_9MUSC
MSIQIPQNLCKISTGYVRPNQKGNCLLLSAPRVYARGGRFVMSYAACIFDAITSTITVNVIVTLANGLLHAIINNTFLYLRILRNLSEIIQEYFSGHTLTAVCLIMFTLIP